MRVVIADDEPAARRGVSRLVRAAGLDLVGEAATVEETAALIAEHQPDAAFLDIEMGDGTIFNLLTTLPNPPKVVFVTAFSGHALRAFDFQVVDFLLKPVAADRFGIAVQRLTQRIGADAVLNRLHRPTPFEQQTLQVATSRGLCLIPARDIIYLEAERDFTYLHVQGSAPMLASLPLGRFDTLLPTPPFLRINRSLIVNALQIERIVPIDRNTTQIHLRGFHTPLQVGRSARGALRRMLGPLTTEGDIAP
ncbi:LytR/AlgR family response regulator transcription factor [Zavarzinia aquatilis]|nr:LytTR family DNA-binding domain-containing protein [Zavarzinia aquatilis]